MKDKIYAQVGSLMGGVVHNLNTPLMWVMGRAQLIHARNEKLETIKDLTEEEIAKIKEKNIKDITSIQEGAEKIDHILKALGYKIQMVNEGYTSIELKEYLQMEVDFLMADMRFKHETNREISYDSRSYYVKVDYNALTYTLTGIINTILESTKKGRVLKIILHNGLIRLVCPELKLTKDVRETIDSICLCLKDDADIVIDESNGFEISIGLKGV